MTPGGHCNCLQLWHFDFSAAINVFGYTALGLALIDKETSLYSNMGTSSFARAQMDVGIHHFG
jgi:hypothetical protein